MRLYPIDYRYFQNPYTMDEERFMELIDRLGNDKVYGTVVTDAVTISALNNYFARDRLCDYPDAFIWLWRRALMKAYPVYRDAMDIWKERTVKGWFYDNNKTEKITTGIAVKRNLDLTKNVLEDIDKAVKAVLNGQRVTDVIADRVSAAKGTSETDSETNVNEVEKTKARNFNFAYPESNYTGGVIPYDLDNNPSVEFLSTQADAVGKRELDRNTTEHAEGKTTADSTRNDTGKETRKTDDTTDTTTDEIRDTNTKANEAETKDTSQQVIREYTATDIEDITQKLLEDIQVTNFWEQFVVKLEPCFQGVYLVDENFEERGYHYYV